MKQRGQYRHSIDDVYLPIVVRVRCALKHGKSRNCQVAQQRAHIRQRDVVVGVIVNISTNEVCPCDKLIAPAVDDQIDFEGLPSSPRWRLKVQKSSDSLRGFPLGCETA